MSDSDFFKSALDFNNEMDRQRTELDRLKKLQEDQTKAKLETKKVEAAKAVEADRIKGLKSDLNGYYQQSVDAFQKTTATARESNGGRPLFQMGSGLLQNRPQVAGAEKSGATQGLFTKFIPKPR